MDDRIDAEAAQRVHRGPGDLGNATEYLVLAFSPPDAAVLAGHIHSPADARRAKRELASAVEARVVEAIPPTPVARPRFKAISPRNSAKSQF
jgi:hypothetical protein